MPHQFGRVFGSLPISKPPDGEVFASPEPVYTDGGHLTTNPILWLKRKKKVLAKHAAVSPRTRNRLLRARYIDEAMRIVYDSLQSHLPYTHVGPDSLIRGETLEFHKKCVKEYSRVLDLLSKLY